MSAVGFTPIQLYRTTTAGAAPNAANLSPGELAININDADMALYAENASGTVKRLMNNPAGLKYPTADGTAGQAVVTDGAGNLSFTTVGAGDVTLNGAQTLTNKTLTAPTITGAVLNDGYTEEVFAVTGTTPALSPTNGSIQTWTLSANSTPTDALSNGQSLILGITASSFTVTWPSVTWSKVGGSGTAPTLTSSGVNWVILWKVGGTLRGAFLGTA